MKKMATLFQSWKKTLYKKFILKNEMPNFNANAFVKLESHWDDFVQYKISQESEERVMRNQQNAQQKQYHHHMGSGGYRSAIPKWQNLDGGCRGCISNRPNEDTKNPWVSYSTWIC
jgi:hypothetical protein